MALFEKDGVRYELKDTSHVAAFLNNGYVEVKDAAEVEEASAVSSPADEKAESKSVARRRRIQKQR